MLVLFLSDDIMDFVFTIMFRSAVFCCMANFFFKHLADQTSAQEGKLVQIKHLPPIALNFVLPADYPTAQAPQFTLTCEWMSKQQVSFFLNFDYVNWLFY